MKQYRMYRNCWLEFNLDNLENNFRNFKKMVGPDVLIMPAIKANAYGHGIVPVAKVLEECGANYLGVGSVDEGITLRENGIKMPILIFCSNLIQEVADVYVEYDLIPTIISEEAAQAYAAVAPAGSKIFIKIDTGRGRIGVNAEKFPEFFKTIKALDKLKVEGVYSHMAQANWPDAGADYAMWQYERFAKALAGIGEDAETIPFRQLANTPGGIALPEIRMTGVCPGRAMWGYSPLSKRAEHPDLQAPLVAWKSRLAHINEVIGGKFGDNFAATKLTKPLRMGIMVGGISDGISKKIANGGYVLLHGRKCPVGSSISLEHVILDLTDFPDAKVGDEIVIIGKQGAEEIPYTQRMQEWDLPIPKIWTDLNPHMDRLYYRHGKLWAATKDKVFYPLDAK